jgi:hypothetical protein
MSPLLSAEMETEGFLDAVDFLGQENLSLNSLHTPKTQLIRRQTTVNTVNPILIKRPFNFEFIEEEDSPSKIHKPIKTLQNSFRRSIQLDNIQQAILKAMKPLITEIQQLKTEILSLKKENLDFSS